MISIKKILRNPWIIGIVSPILTMVLLKIFDILAGTNIFNQACRVVFKGIGFICNFLNYRISVGLVFGVCIAVSCIVILFKKLFFKRTIRNRPGYLDYNEDTFLNVLYRWKYVFTNGKYKIGNIVAYCPTCKHRIVHNECLSCNSSFLIDKKDRQQREAMIRYCIEDKYQINEFYELGE